MTNALREEHEINFMRLMADAETFNYIYIHKCTLITTSMNYLVHNISESKIKPDQKTLFIKDLPRDMNSLSSYVFILFPLIFQLLLS